MSTLTSIYEYIKKNWLFALSLTLVSFTILQPLHNALIWDDVYFFDPKSPLVSDSNAWNVLTRPFWQNSTFVQQKLTLFWRPTTTFVLWLATRGGINATLLHLLSVVSAGVATLLFVWVVYIIYPSPKSKQTIILAGLIYLSHPLTAETYCLVANVSDHLALTFILLIVICTKKYYDSRMPLLWLPAIALLAFAASGSKEFGLICLLTPLLIFHPAIATSTSSIIRKWHHVALGMALLIGIITYLVALSHISSLSQFANHRSATDLSASTALAGIGLALFKQLYIAPSASSISASTPTGYIAISLSVFVILLLSVISRIRKQQYSFNGHIVFILGIVLMTPSFITIEQTTSEVLYPIRYFHLALLGTIGAIIPLLNKLNQSTKGRLTILSIIAFLCLLSYMRVSIWRDSISFFAEEVRLNPASEIFTLSLAEEYITIQAFTEAEKAIANFEKQYTFSSSQTKSHRNTIMSQVYFLRDGNLKRALELGKKAIEQFPHNPVFVVRFANVVAVSHGVQAAIKMLESASQDKNFKPRQREELRAAIARLKQMAEIPTHEQ